MVVEGGGWWCWGVRGGGEGDDGVVGVVNLMEVVLNFGGGREVIVVGFDEIGGGEWLVEVEGGGRVERGCRGGGAGLRRWWCGGGSGGGGGGDEVGVWFWWKMKMEKMKEEIGKKEKKFK